MSGCRTAAILALVMLGASSVFACDYPLSTEAIREAYFIGTRGDISTAEFIEQYTRHFPIPEQGPQIGMIQLETPYVQVVERSEQALNYHAPDAVQEFLGTLTEFQVRVQIFFTPSYSAAVRVKHGKITVRAASFWRDFKIKLSQHTEIQPERVTEHALYGNGRNGRWQGAEVELDYPATAVRSEPAQVEVRGPGGSDATANFDLAKLH